MLRIIDHKRIELTDSEFKLYQDICKSYDAPNRKGEDLFKDLFETNEQGIIIFLKPPTKNYSSMEVFMFLVTLFIHQHVGSACTEADSVIKEAKLATLEAKQTIKQMQDLMATLKPQ